ncbi:hypothetical protein FFLO_02445 [Filobasidium floriforme]|uniref:Uncharacterized protein n=1 Tax=Filobasidium floriforme TaxID=5210 RepID=A0A8K0JMT4_9TREE|nr:uncharacterized protein HD553DRAFT_324976 [Filobasidium floriforme]KAG7562163.1 hypothetical protein FFLO_02445 [Filobasidium floriforme]KAH8082729.1 hypothetical protein HD553DRAFT_324976 [Filobasidium floriforme]
MAQKLPGSCFVPFLARVLPRNKAIKTDKTNVKQVLGLKRSFHSESLDSQPTSLVRHHASKEAALAGRPSSRRKRLERWPSAFPQDLDLPASTAVTHIPISKTAIGKYEDKDEVVDLDILSNLIKTEDIDPLETTTGDLEDVVVIRVKDGELEDVDVIGVKDLSESNFKAKIKALNHDAVQWLKQSKTSEEGCKMAKKAYPTVCRLMANHPAFDINEVAFLLNPRFGQAYSDLDLNTYLTSTLLLVCGIEAKGGPGIYTFSWAKVPKNYSGKLVHPRKRLDEHWPGAASTGINRYIGYAKETWPVATWKTAVILVFPLDCPQGILSAIETLVISIFALACILIFKLNFLVLQKLFTGPISHHRQLSSTSSIDSA